MFLVGKKMCSSGRRWPILAICWWCCNVEEGPTGPMNSSEPFAPTSTKYSQLVQDSHITTSSEAMLQHDSHDEERGEGPMLWQVWPARNRPCCRGSCLVGPDYSTFFCNCMLVGVNSGVCWLVALCFRCLLVFSLVVLCVRQYLLSLLSGETVAVH